MSRLVVPFVFTIIVVVGTTHTAQTPAKFRRQLGERVFGQYIVVLHDNAVNGASVSALSNELSLAHRGDRLHTYTTALTGFAARMSEADARALSEDPRVAYVEEDGVAYGSARQLDPSNYGLDRIDQRHLPLDASYSYFADGKGVNVYIVDSGIRVTHTGFGGRARGAFSAVPDGIPADQDCLGHGTHVAGIAGSAPWGVAKQINLFSIKVLGCDNTGSWSSVIAGLDWIVTNGVKPAVVNASLAGGFDSAAAEAINRLVAAGFTYVGAAGNGNADACGLIPGGAALAFVVGSVSNLDTRASYSNWGNCVDLFAPGDGIQSAYNTDDNSSAYLYGTSMAAPHVTGAAALYLQRFPTASPATVKAEILRGATRDVLQEILPESPNLLLFASYLGDSVAPGVMLTSPSAGSTVMGMVTLTASASDNVEVQGVRFFVGSTQIAFDQTVPYSVSWNSTSVLDGAQTVRARSVDLAGNTRDSTASVTVRNGNDTTLPTVSLTSPLLGDILAGVVTTRADATDDIGVARVEFLADGVVVGVDSSAPYSTNWNTIAIGDGAHTLSARAFDNAGNNRLSTFVRVDVQNGGAQLPSGWTNDDVGAVEQPGNATQMSGTFTLQAGGSDIWSTSDAFHFAYRSWTGDGDIVARVADLPLPAGASFAMSGVMFRESLSAGARHASVLIATNGKLKFRRRTAVGGQTLSDGPPEGSLFAPQWLKITRRGNVFMAYRSVNGTTWTQVGEATTISLPATLHVGIWASRNGGTALAQSKVTNVVVNSVTGPMPAGWTNGDVGVGQVGNAGYENGTFALQAAGSDLWSTTDAFHYVYRSWTGDGDIVARVSNLPLPAGSTFAMAGVMFRESLAPNARHASVLIATNGKLKFRRRTAVGAETLSDGPSEGSLTAPYWLKLSRRGNVLTAYRSLDGKTWTQVGPQATIAMPATLHVGVWALRNGGAALASATLTNVTMTP